MDATKNIVLNMVTQKLTTPIHELPLKGTSSLWACWNLSLVIKPRGESLKGHQHFLA